MKKCTFILVAILLLSFAQSAGAQHRVGILGGLNFTKIDIEVQRESATVSSRTLFGIGGILDVRVSQSLRLCLQPMYLQKGVGKTRLAIQPGVEWVAKSSYLELPLLVKAEFGNTAKPYVLAGPSVGVLLRSELEAQMGGITFTGDAKDVTKSLDFAVVFGAGISFPFGKNLVFIEGRYSLGLTDTVAGGTFDISAGPVVEEITWDEQTDMIKNRGFQIMAGVAFALGD